MTIDKRVEISKEKYESTMLEIIDTLENEYLAALLEFNGVVKIWNRYLNNKNDFKIIYYKKGNDILYKKFKKTIPGFKYKK